MAYPMVPPAASPMVHIALDDTLGAAFLACTESQCFRHTSITDAIQTIDYILRLWCSGYVYLYAVTDFGNFLALEVPTWSVLGVSDLIVRGQQQELVLDCVDQLADPPGIKGGDVSRCLWRKYRFGIPNYPALVEISDILYVSLGAGVAADIFIAASMCVLLAQRQTGFARCVQVFRVPGAFHPVFSSDISTFLCALLTLITYATMPDNFIFIGFYFVLPKLPGRSYPQYSVPQFVAGDIERSAEFARGHRYFGFHTPISNEFASAAV
ncbi:hypothetical protein C8Q79DRAFT_926290 [Trametes meyenii]|nr:hypothetical protein C8Q79DRAFT_926290 [Trametes meyenii]